MCCGQPGTSDSPQFICPTPEKPYCVGFVQGTRFGWCSSIDAALGPPPPPLPPPPSVHCGGDDVEPLADGTPSHWHGDLGECERKCTADPSCNAFVRRASDSVCQWKSNVTMSTMTSSSPDHGISCHLDQGRYTPSTNVLRVPFLTLPPPRSQSLLAAQIFDDLPPRTPQRCSLLVCANQKTRYLLRCVRCVQLKAKS